MKLLCKTLILVSQNNNNGATFLNIVVFLTFNKFKSLSINGVKLNISLCAKMEKVTEYFKRESKAE